MGYQTPFHDVPKGRFLRRAILPAVLLYWIGFVWMGWLVQNDEPKYRGMSLMEAARSYHSSLIDEYRAIPGACLWGRARSDFEAQRCSDTWEKFRGRAYVGMIPVSLAGIFLLISLDLLVVNYRKGRKLLLKGRPIGSGKAVGGLGLDAFGWFLCLRGVHVRLSDGREIRAYQPEGVAPLKEGDPVVIFDAGRSLGKQRFYALLFTPHVAVIRGVES